MADLSKKIKSRRKAIDEEDDVQQRKYSDLQKAKELEQSNTYTSSLSVIAETPILPPPPPPPLLQNAAPLPPPPTASKCTEKPKNGSQEKANESKHDRSALLEQIRKGGVKLKRVNNNEVENAKTPGNNKDGKSQDFLDELKENLKSRRKVIVGKDNVQQLSNLGEAFSRMSAMISPPRSRSSSVSSSSSEESEQDWSDNESTYSTPLNPQLDNKKRSESPDSGHESDDNEKSKPTSPLHSAGKPLVPPKTAGLQTKSEASPAAQVKNVDPVNTSHSINSICELFGGKANKLQKQNVAKRY